MTSFYLQLLDYVGIEFPGQGEWLHNMYNNILHKHSWTFWISLLQAPQVNIHLLSL